MNRAKGKTLGNLWGRLGVLMTSVLLVGGMGTGVWAGAITKANIEFANGALPYTGVAKVAADLGAVTINDDGGADNEDCVGTVASFSTGSPTNAGKYGVTVNITGCKSDGDSKDVSLLTVLSTDANAFEIEAIEPEEDTHFTTNLPLERVPSGATTSPYGITLTQVSPFSAVTGAATYKFFDDQSAPATPPLSVGTYSVKVSFAAGGNYTATTSDIELTGDYEVVEPTLRDKEFEAADIITSPVATIRLDYGTKATVANPKISTVAADYGYLRAIDYSVWTSGKTTRLSPLNGARDSLYTGRQKNDDTKITGSQTLPWYFDVTAANEPHEVWAICTTFTSATGTLSGQSQVKGFVEVKIADIHVSPKEVTDAMLTVTGTWTYTGNAIMPDITYKDSSAATGKLKITAAMFDFTQSPTSSRTKAGEASVIGSAKSGAGMNYKGRAAANFTIQKARITLDVWPSEKIVKDFDGKTGAAEETFTLTFDDLVNDEELDPGVDYTITNGVYASAAAGDDKNVTATVRLTDSPKASNYTLTNAGTNTFRYAGKINKVWPGDVDPDGDDASLIDTFFNYKIPTDKFQNGNVQGIGTVAFKNNIADGGSRLTVRYRYDGVTNKVMKNATEEASGVNYKMLGEDCKDALDNDIDCGIDTTLAPRVAGTYPVIVYFTPGTNFEASPENDYLTGELADHRAAKGWFILGNYTVSEPEEPDLGSGIIGATSTRQGNPITLSVVATVDNGAKLAYQWYTCTSTDDTDDCTVIAGATSASYKYNAPRQSEDGIEFRVKVTTNSPTIQTAVSTWSDAFNVKVVEPAKPMIRPYIVITEGLEFTYNGTEIEIDETDITVYTYESTDEDAELAEVDKDLIEFTYLNNINAGENVATLRATTVGLNEYAGTVTVKFSIKKKEVNQFDFDYLPARVFVPANLSKGAEVKLAEGMTGLGDFTVKYDGATTVPTTSGAYPVTVSVAGNGTNFTAGSDDLWIGMYRINKKTADTSDLTFSIASKVYDSTAQGIGPVTVKAAMGTADVDYGDLEVLYNGYPELPIEIGTYTVTVHIEEGENFNEVTVVLGEFNITDPNVSVAKADREVPVIDDTKLEARITPVKPVSAAAFTAGPNPVTKSGTVSFFSTKQVKSGKLFIYASTGKLVKRVAVSAGTGKVAVWQVSGAAEGVYAVKGVLTAKDGTKEKVSSIISVVK